MTEANKLVLEFAAGHNVFTLVEAYQHCQTFSDDEMYQESTNTVKLAM